MFDWLAGLAPFAGGAMGAPLAGVNGFTGGGRIRYAACGANRRRLRIDLKGVAGRVAEIHVDGVLAGRMRVKDGRSCATFASTRGDAIPPLGEGARIEIRQNGETILAGVLSRSGRVSSRARLANP